MKNNTCHENKVSETVFHERRTGVVVPLGALYSKKHSTVGEFPALAEFAGFCRKAGLRIIQLLPVNDTGTQSSPYSGLSAFALHPVYISLPDIPEFSGVYATDISFAKKYDNFINNNPYKNRFDYDAVLTAKTELLRALYETTGTAASGTPDGELTEWIRANQWIVPYAVYKNLKWKYLQSTWKSWERADRDLTEREITGRWNDQNTKKEHLFYAWTQMQAARQFAQAANEVRNCGIILKGDMPILMNEDSCDAWSQPQIFNQSLRAGAPADGENPNGQNWGFPTYNWNYLKSTDYAWWKERLASAAQYYGAYRLDHILGFFRIWAVPERDTTAVLGHTEPYKSISREELHKAGFNDGRIRWLSQPHVRTGVVQDITWNYESARTILSSCASQLPGEELWIFKNNIKGDKDIHCLDFGETCTKEAADRIKEKLARLWLDRSLIEIEPDQFVPVWTYESSTAWKTLSGDEKQKLSALFLALAQEESVLWKEQASGILGSLTRSVNMVPCGEDLGVNLPCLPPVMKENNILSLRVVRWSREWNKSGQPYVPFGEYPALSVTTTSVHDSPTIREWWDSDAHAASLFVNTFPAAFGAPAEAGDRRQTELRNATPFTPGTAHSILSAAAEAGSIWCIHPLQDFLYMNKAYWLADPGNERINIPGTVSAFNWTYRMPVPIETLDSDNELISQILSVADAHAGEK